jgi:hypothetical protein
MTNCHVSEKPKRGPLTAHTITIVAASMKVDARPMPGPSCLPVHRRTPPRRGSFPSFACQRS